MDSCELIHQHVRAAIETAVPEELRAALGTSPYERRDVRRGYRNGVRERTLTGPTGPVALTLPRATLFSGTGDVKEWRSRIVPRYQRRIPEVNEAAIATYLAGGNTRRIRGVSRDIATLKGGLEAWRTRSLTDLDVIYVYLDGFALPASRCWPASESLSTGANSSSPWNCAQASRSRRGMGCLEDLVARALQAPVLAIIDGNAGLRRAGGLVWPKAAVQRCCVHKLRNLERKAPKHALADIRDDFHRIVYAANADTARTAYAAFERTWNKRCPGVVTSQREGGDELLTFFRFPKTQWKTLRTTNTIERLHEEFRRRVKTQGSLPTEDAALVLLFSLVASGQIKLRKIDGWQKIGAVLNQHTAVAA
jgi:transposase-like protein